jgi:hypothetical protein
VSDQGDPQGWRHSLQEQLLDVFDRHGASVAVGLTATGVAIRSQDERVDASYVLKVSAQPVDEGTLRWPGPGTGGYKLVIIAKRSLNLKAIPPHRRQEAELIVGKDNLVLKDRYGDERNLTERELARILANAETVVQI